MIIKTRCLVNPKNASRPLGTLYPLDNTQVDKSQFKVGSLDQLMELMDTFAKYDMIVDGSCKRNEKMYHDICKEKNQDPDLKIEVSTG